MHMRFFATLTLCGTMLWCGPNFCHSQETKVQQNFSGQFDFDIYWPPREVKLDESPNDQPLLRGELTIQEALATRTTSEIQVQMTLTRPSEEAERAYWNSKLSFADIEWMEEVRVWDRNDGWIWPNLPYLLRRNGKERVERYGGVDPSKHVDNDFAAILIRKFTADGTVESLETKDEPLVSAEWLPLNEKPTTIHSIVHQANSDTFQLHVGEKRGEEGKIKLWLIYADFLGAKPPATWSQEREWAGGVLSYCELNWKKLNGDPLHVDVTFKPPSEGTRFAWWLWSRNNADATARLTDEDYQKARSAGARFK